MLDKLRGNPWAVLAALCPGMFITLLDLTIVNVAVPDISDDLGAGLDEILWVVNIYALALATLIITAGRLGDLFGKQRLYVGGVLLFTVASFACGLAQDPTQLIILRGVQGVGAAMIMPQTLSIIADIFPPGKRGVALGVWGAVVGLSGAAGPTVGGLLITNLSWRWIFFVNIPVGAVALIMAAAFMPRMKKSVRHRLDIPGVALATAALLCLTYALIEGERYDWANWIWALLAVAGVLLIVFLRYERSQQDNEPLLPFSPFRDRNFSIVNGVGVVASFGVIGLLLPVVIYMQSVLGFSALKTGLVLLALAGGGVVSSAPAGILAEKFGAKFILMFGLVSFAAGLVWLAAVAEPGAGWVSSLGPLFLAGFGAGCTFTPMASEVVRNVPVSLNGAASGVHNSLRQVGSVLAGAVVGAMLQARLASSLVEQAEQKAQEVPEQYREDFVAQFSDAGGRGIDVGTEQGANVPADLPADVAANLQQAASEVFENAFVAAMWPAMLVAALAMVAGAVACFALKPVTKRTVDAYGLPIVNADDNTSETEQPGTEHDPVHS